MTNWDLKYGRVLGKSRETQEVNGKLDKIRLGIEESYSKILKNEGTVNSAKLKNAFLGMESGELTFFKFYEQFLFGFISQECSHNFRYGIVQPVTRCTGRGLRRRTVCQTNEEEKEEREEVVKNIYWDFSSK
ncbi:hypothetical protein [Elizabethkingia anophelis]|uniref:hypothetical protein n=1 Tax=Elizabethkingia anophelis TaxID=1117645 RepID=UPI00405930F8